MKTETLSRVHTLINPATIVFGEHRSRTGHQAVGRVLFLSLALALVIGGITPGVRAAEPTHLPTSLNGPAQLELIPAPNGGDHRLFYWFEPPNQARFGVAEADGRILWQRQVGFRPLVEFFWAADGKSVLFVTDCIQEEAELRAPHDRTRSYLFVLAAHDGTVLGQGDLDTDVLDLAQQCPAAVGASHDLKLELADGIITAMIDHQGQKITGRRPLADLAPAGPN
jgi:hypothetical protein